MEMQTAYKVLGGLFLLAALGSVLNYIISFDATNIGQKIGIVASFGINFLVGLGFFNYAKKESQQVTSEEFEETFKKLNKQGGKK